MNLTLASNSNTRSCIKWLTSLWYVPILTPTRPPPSSVIVSQVLQNFVPYVINMGADVAAMVEKCSVVDDSTDLSGRSIKKIPNASCLGFGNEVT